jgi:putative spermidine/putrescine transport system permease protein
VDAERPPRERHALQRGETDHAGEHPQDPRRRARPNAQQRVGDDGLETLCDAADEVQRAVVLDRTRPALGQRRPREERRAGDVVGAEDRGRREAGVGLRERDTHQETRVHGEVGDDVDERAPLRRRGGAGDHPVQAVEHTVREPEPERDVAEAGPDGDAGADADDHAGRSHGVGSNAGLGRARPDRAKRAIRRRAKPSIEHDGQTPDRRAGIPLGLLPALTALILLLGGALVGLLFDSLRPGALRGGSFGVGDWRAILSDPAFHAALRFTVLVAVASTAVSAVLAVAVGATLQGRAGWLRGAVASAVPMPHLVAASLAVTWLAPGGLAERLAGVLPVQLVGDSHGLGIVAVYVYKEAPFLALLVLAAWDQHTRDLEEVARSLGAGRIARLRDAVLPRIGPPLLAGSLVVAAFTLGASEVPLLVGPTHPDTIATYSLTTVRIDGPVARAQGTAALVIVSAMSMTLGIAAALVQRRRRVRR